MCVLVYPWAWVCMYVMSRYMGTCLPRCEIIDCCQRCCVHINICVCAQMYICMHLYTIHIYIIYMHVYAMHIYACTSLHIHICIHTYTRLLKINAHLYIGMSIHLYIHTYIVMHEHTWGCTRQRIWGWERGGKRGGWGWKGGLGGSHQPWVATIIRVPKISGFSCKKALQ